MRDLTQHSIVRHIVQLALPIMAGMVFQTLYLLIDLYFVSRLGNAALAGVSASGNVLFIVMALTQVLGVGTVALISHRVGSKDQAGAQAVFNQSIVLSAGCTVATLIAGYGLARPYMTALGADAATVSAGCVYLEWFLPSLALQFVTTAMASALRGTGIVQPTMLVQVLSVILNAVLAPVLIAGWGTHHPLGVAGAGLASSVSVGVGVVLLAVYFHKLEHYVRFDRSALRPDLVLWRRLIAIGLPAGGEFALMFLYMAVIYWIIRRFGEDAQAGFGIAMRIMQSLFLPALAVSFATAPIVGQNFGARRFERVRESFRWSMILGGAIMLVLMVICRWRADWLLTGFTKDPATLAVASEFLHIVSLNFIASGFVMTCSAVFQGLGNTVPSVLSAGTRIVSFVVPALWLAAQPQFRLVELWYVSVASVALQALVSYFLLRVEFERKLNPIEAAVCVPSASTQSHRHRVV
jgi:putative MATE family efflux protein